MINKKKPKPNYLHKQYKKSLFRRLLSYHMLIGLVAIIAFCLIWYRTTSNWLMDQHISYNNMQIDALYEEVYRQHLTLKQTQYRIYSYLQEETQLNENIVAEFINQEETGFFDPLRRSQIQSRFRSLERYLSNGMTPAENVMDYLLIASTNLENYHTIRINNSGRSYPDDFQTTVCREIALYNASASRRSVYTVPPFLTHNDDLLHHNYVLYDYLRNFDDPTEPIGYLIGVYHLNHLDRILDQFIDPLIGTAYVLDQQGHILYDSSYANLGAIYPDFVNISSLRNQSFENKPYITTVRYDQEFNFFIIGQIDKNIILQRGNENFRIIFQVAIGAGILILLLSSLLIRSTVVRVHHLLDAIYRARKNVAIRAPLAGKEDEIDAISYGFNEMLRRLSSFIEKEYVQKLERQDVMLKQRDAELYAFQSQVNPHFLYNTMEIIRMKALENHDEDAAMMIKTLALSFRNRIKGSLIVSLKEELDACTQLLEIYNIRYNSMIYIDENIVSDLLSCSIPRDLLTPIIENVMVHGFDPDMNPDDLEIKVTAHKENGFIHMQVTDNGSGISNDELNRLNEKLQRPLLIKNNNIGLTNIQQRIKLIYGETCGINITPNMPQGTIVNIKVLSYNSDHLASEIDKKFQDKLI